MPSTRPWSCTWRGGRRAKDLLDRTLAAGHLDEVTEGRLQALRVEVLLAADHGTADGPADAGKAVDRLAALADARPRPYLEALVVAARGRLCLALGTDEARTFLHQAVRAFDRAQLPVDAARAQLDLARALAASSPDGRGGPGEGRAGCVHRRLGHPGRGRRGGGAPLARASVTSGARSRQDLTAREQEVLALVGHGLSNGEIGARLHVSPKTVEHHVGRILAKLALASRAQAVAYAASRRSGP